MNITIYHKISWAEPTGQLDRIEKLIKEQSSIMAKLATTLDEVLAEVKAQTDVIKGVDALVESLAAQLKEAISSSKDLAEAEEKVANILATVQENKEALVAAANVGTEDETPEDVKVIEEFESLPPQPLDKPESK